MKTLLTLCLALIAASPALAQAPSPPSSTLDGQWRGRSDGGACNAPLDYVLTIESSIVDGSAYDTSARGPVPNLKKTAPPPPTPSLWQIYGVVKGSTFSLMTLASVKGEDRRRGKLTATVQGSTLVVTESGGCGRTARLTKG